jgi:predicted nucleic acid-binding protein
VSVVYLDACTIIYLVEGTPAFQAAAAAFVAPYQSDPSARLVTSRLSRMECRVKPLREGKATLLAVYESFFSARRMQFAEVSPAVVERATELRARYQVRTPDALHLATAIESGAVAFLTGDVALKRCTELNVQVITP